MDGLVPASAFDCDVDFGSALKFPIESVGGRGAVYGDVIDFLDNIPVLDAERLDQATSLDIADAEPGNLTVPKDRLRSAHVENLVETGDVFVDFPNVELELVRCELVTGKAAAAPEKP